MLAELELHLVELGFERLFGIGLWAKDVNGTVVDTNSGSAKVIPHIDASFDNFVGFADTIQELDAVIDRSEVTPFFIECRAELSRP